MINGWIKLHRQMQNNPVIMKDADHLAIWIWLLMNATHAEYDAWFDNKRITLKPGQLITSRYTIQGVLGVDDSKIDRVLNLFKIERQIEQLSTSKNRLITIVKWASYQNNEPPIKPPVSHGRATTEPRVSINKKGRREEEKEGKKDGGTSPDTTTTADSERLASLLADGVRQTNPAFLQKYPTNRECSREISAWARDIEKLMRIDKATAEQVGFVLKWLFTHESRDSAFWRTNIRSGDKLRKQYMTLVPLVKRDLEGAQKNSIPKI